MLSKVPYWSGPQLRGNWDVIWYYTAQHVRFTLAALAIGTVLAFPLAYSCHRFPKLYPPVLAATNIAYAIPSLALFTLLFPIFGYTNDKPIVTAMAVYTLVILVRNMVEGLRAVPGHVSDAATGLGYGPFRRFALVELPLAVPTIVAGLRLATVSTISLISVGAALGKGALGRLFSDGIARIIPVEIWSGVVAVVALALAADVLLLGIGRALTPWVGARSSARTSGRRSRRVAVPV
jgi:osmoprotectant transport system permease protein